MSVHMFCFQSYLNENINRASTLGRLCGEKVLQKDTVKICSPILRSLNQFYKFLTAYNIFQFSMIL